MGNKIIGICALAVSGALHGWPWRYYETPTFLILNLLAAAGVLLLLLGIASDDGPLIERLARGLWGVVRQLYATATRKKKSSHVRFLPDKGPQ